MSLSSVREPSPKPRRQPLICAGSWRLGVFPPSRYRQWKTGLRRPPHLVVLTVPFSHHSSTLEQVREALSGKILVDVTVPLVPPKVGTVQLPEGGSAGEIAQHLLGDEVRVVSAFQNVAAQHLQQGHELDCDVLVTGNSKQARELVIGLVEAAGMRGFHAGPIANAAAAEALTSVLITINRRYRCHSGIRITGLGDDHD